MPYADPRKKREYHRRKSREHYERNRATCIVRARVRQDRRFTDPVAREEWRAYKRTARRKAGARPISQVRQEAPDRKARLLAEREARLLAKPKPMTANERHHHRWRTDPKYRLYHRLKRWMQKHLRNGRTSKVWGPRLGYTVDELHAHIERQFTDGMGWHNMGEWHIDHIKPVCTFDFSSPDDREFIECYALSNLRPLWAKENLRRTAGIRKGVSRVKGSRVLGRHGQAGYSSHPINAAPNAS